MKKLLVLVLALLMLSVSACAEDALRVIALKGPTAMGMVQVMDRTDNGDLKGQYDFTIAAAIDEVTPQIAQGNVDIAAVPANLASVLYNKTEGGVKLLGVNTGGVLYLLSNNADPVSSQCRKSSPLSRNIQAGSTASTKARLAVFCFR